MSSSESPPRVSLTVHTEDAESEVFVIDGAWKLVGRGLGTLAGRYAPGLYKVKVQTGSRLRERFVRLEPGREQLVGNLEGATLKREVGGATLSFPRLHFATAVPLAETSWSREEHTRAAVTHSRQVHVRRGQGSQLFVFMRTWVEAPRADGAPGTPPSFRLALHALDGTRLVDLGTEGARDEALEAPWAACTVELDPGPYLLRRTTEEGEALDAVVVASPGWQTQVFLCEMHGRPGQGGAPCGALHASIHLRRPERGFDPASPGLRLTELTRLGLRNHRAVITPELLRELKDTEERNPMLGIYGAHLLLLEEAPDLGLVRKVVGHLRGLLGTHPDVEALALRVGEPLAATDLFRVPPTLLRSWALVVRETAKRPELIPRGSLSAAAAERLWGEGPWFIWKALPPVATFTAARPGGAGTVPSLEELAECLQGVPHEALQGLREASALERGLIAHLRGQRPTAAAGPPVRRATPVAPLRPSTERMVRALGVPAATLEKVLLHLLERLEVGKA